MAPGNRDEGVTASDVTGKEKLRDGPSGGSGRLVSSAVMAGSKRPLEAQQPQQKQQQQQQQRQQGGGGVPKQPGASGAEGGPKAGGSVGIGKVQQPQPQVRVYLHNVILVHKVIEQRQHFSFGHLAVANRNCQFI